MTREEIEEQYEDVVFWDGLDEAILGMAERINLSVVAYDVDKIIEILMADMEVTEDELEEDRTIESMKYEMALEYYEFNIVGAWVGEYTPVHIKLSV
jgi:hypothetical protein